ncbi:hypothetical protein MKW98_002944 [Papaver atlanticum]|uniref:Transmembrane protein n=1 Tax=Papaver atlanticum TaxID=357466 RepID=A0AAD4XQF4_9MAGN|nr:hypothetical protein MKW98_002944 [Papaver atlanticum]
MESISKRFPRTIFLIMFLLIGFNLLTTITAVKDDTEVNFIKMNINISRKLLRVRPIRNKIPSPRGNPSAQYINRSSPDYI